MAILPVHHKKKAAAHSKNTKKTGGAPKPRRVVAPREIGVGEFKAKCLGLIDEINKTGQELIVTKRGVPAAKVSPLKPAKTESLIGRLEGIIEIIGDPDDLIKPVFPLEDYDMLK